MTRTPHFLYLVNGKFMSLTEKEAEKRKQAGVIVENIHKFMDLEPDFIDIKKQRNTEKV